MSQNNNSSGGFGVAGLLGVVFVTLKLLDKINWSWWWVLAPFWAPLVLALVIIVFALVMMVLTGQHKRKR